jgi:ribonucleoside-diphosphate reductase alpha chain
VLDGFKLQTVFTPREGLPSTIFSERHAISPSETWEQGSRRVARHVSAAEVGEKRQPTEEVFYEEIVTNRFMPGGRIWYGSGRTRSMLMNCFLSAMPADSREGWGKAISDVIVISGMGGGVGTNMSSIRPRGSKINGTGGIATGAVSLMQMIDRVGDILVSGGGRRLALMLSLNITHPDMPEFLSIKLDKKELTNANISLMIDKRMPTNRWIKSVKEGKDFDLIWRNNVINTVNAKEVWEKIVTNAWASGEPGIINADFANRENNIAYYLPLVGTNPCSEQVLEEYGACCLGSLVLPRFVKNGQMDWDQLRSTINVSVRFLDDVLNTSEYPLPAIRENVLNVRRIGLGVMGLHSMLIALGYQYSSDSAHKYIDELFHFIKIATYEASVELAIEKGTFPVYSDEFLDSGFIRRAIPQKLQMKIRKNGIRNCALLTCAPTGTTSMIASVSSGIEPLFAPAYWRRFYRPTEDGNRKLDKELVVDPLWNAVEDKNLLEGAYDVTPENHFEVQRIIQKHIDSAISKTINLPTDYKVDNLSDLWLEYLPFVKGSTFYRAGSRGEEPLEAIDLVQAKQLLSERSAEEGNIAESSLMDCPDGQCDVSHKPIIEVKE